MRQLPLEIKPRDDASFVSFLTTDANRLAVASLRRLPGCDRYGLIYLHGPLGCGRSHLLQALCHESSQSACESLYLPLAELGGFRPDEIFAKLESQPVLCLDDIDSVAGRESWELQLFNLLNRKMLLGGSIVVASTRPPELAGFHLPDLVSRLKQGLVLGLPEPGDRDKAQIFIWRGRQRGMHIAPKVADFVMTHSGRDLHGLMRLLDDMDAQSLTQQRRITVPFIRDLLARRAGAG